MNVGVVKKSNLTKYSQENWNNLNTDQGQNQRSEAKIFWETCSMTAKETIETCMKSIQHIHNYIIDSINIIFLLPNSIAN